MIKARSGSPDVGAVGLRLLGCVWWSILYCGIARVLKAIEDSVIVQLWNSTPTLFSCSQSLFLCVKDTVGVFADTLVACRMPGGSPPSVARLDQNTEIAVAYRVSDGRSVCMVFAAYAQPHADYSRFYRECHARYGRRLGVDFASVIPALPCC